MSGKKTLLWAVILLTLAAFYYGYEIRGEKGRREAARQKELVLQLRADEVTGLTLRRSAETIAAVKRDGHWHLTEPLAVPADDQKYQELVQYLTDLRHLRIVDEHPPALDSFGLTSPALEVQVQRQGAAAPLVVRLGEKNPTGSGYYTQVEGQPAVYLLGTAAKDVLDASLLALRDKTVLAFADREVQEIQLAFAADPPIHLRRQEGERWELQTPVRAAADLTQVQALLRSLREVKVQTFVAEQAADREAFGLQAPALRLTLTVDQNRTLPPVLLGKTDPERQGIYATRGDATPVWLLPQSFWDSLPKSATALRDKTLLQYDLDRITRLELRGADDPVVITRAGPQQYRLEQPVEAPGDYASITTLLREVRDLKARDFVDEAPEQRAPYGLDTPRRQVVLWEEPADKAQEARQQVLLVGGDAPEQQGTYVQRGDRPTVYLVEPEAAQRILRKTAFELRDKKLLPLEVASIHKVQFQYPTVTLTMERRGAVWQLSEPNQQAIPQTWRVESLVRELSTLEYAKMMPPPGGEPTPYGLENPQVRVTLWQKDGAVVGPLLLGNTVEDPGDGTKLVYAQVGSQRYMVRDKALTNWPKTASDLVAEK